jgi:hypothetical protein
VKEKLEKFVFSDLNSKVALEGIEAFDARSSARMGKRTWNRDNLLVDFEVEAGENTRDHQSQRQSSFPWVKLDIV